MAAKQATDALVLREIIKTQQWRAPVWCGDIDDEGHVTVLPYGRTLESTPLWIWEMPQQDVAYTVAIDPAFSLDRSGNPAAIQVLRGSGQAAEVRLQEATAAAQAAVCFWLGSFYNWASLVVEMNGLGDTLLRMLRAVEYKNLWHERVTRPGWTTTHTTRVVMSAQFVSLSVGGQMALRSSRLLEEIEAAAAGDDQASHDLMDAYAIGCAAQAMPAARG